MRPYWKGYLKLALVSCPIALHAACSSAERIAFRQVEGWLGWQARTAPTETDCLAGHVRFELRNVGANYPFERSHKFAGNQPNSGHGDRSRLSCSAGDTQLRPGVLRNTHGRWSA